MKKIISISIFIFVCTLCFVACGKKDETNTPGTTTIAGEPTEPWTWPSNEPKEPDPADAGNFVQNGAFDSGIAGWVVYPMVGGNGAISNVGGAMSVEVKATGTAQHGVQVAYDGARLYTNCGYVAEFDISSTVTRHAEFRIQQNGGSYDNYLLANPENVTVFEIGPEVKHFSFNFLMEGQDLAPRIAFNFGRFTEDSKLDPHTITVDNVKVKRTSGSEEYVDLLNRPLIVVNQVGYYTNGTKEVLFATEKDNIEFEDQFVVLNSAKEVVFTGDLSTPAENVDSGDKVASGDFSAFTTPGTYTIMAVSKDEDLAAGETGWGESYEFTIGNNIYDDLFTDVVMMLYSQRCGCEVEDDVVGAGYGHDACHTSNATIYGTHTEIDVTGGWHDAGDYGRYVSPGAKTVADLLLQYQKFGDVFNYAEGVTENSEMPDILEEAKYELDWMLKMQTEEGSVYHKVTSYDFPGEILADQDTLPLIVFPTSYTATADFTAVMAKASYLYKPFDTTFAATCLEAAKNAFEYLADIEVADLVNEELDPSIGFKNPVLLDEDLNKILDPEGYYMRVVNSGEYPDMVCTDEMLWALSELYVADTGNSETYLNLFYTLFDKLGVATDWEAGLGWQEMSYYAMYTFLKTRPEIDPIYGSVKAKFVDQVNKIVAKIEADAYNSSVSTVYPWGSNMTIANSGMILLLANDILPVEEQYDFDLISSQVDYLLGLNANVYCFVSGYGTLSPEEPHHRPSQYAYANDSAALKGMLIGGPNSDFANNGNDSVAKGNLIERPAARCYIDKSGAWSLNEVTIYWNSPLIFLLSGVIKNFSD